MSPTNNSKPISPDAAIPVAIYTRVSTDGQAGFRYDSCEHQANVCREFIRRSGAAGWFEAGYFKDEAYSGATLDRPGVKHLMREIAGGRIKIVLVYKLERILRSTYEWARLQEFLNAHGCQLLSPNEDHSDPSASGRLKSNMLVSFAEYERMNVAEKTRSKMLAQAQRGMWGGGFIPFGYDYDRERQELRPAQAEASVVLRIFGCAAALQSLGQIAGKLNADGIRTGRRWMRDANRVRQPVGQKPFRTDILRKLIQNPVYRGTIRYGGQEFRGQHEPLVTAALWEQANAAVAEAKRKPKVALRPRDKHSNLLKGFVYCARCESPLFSRASGKETSSGRLYRYYTCARTSHRKERERCSLGNIPAESLENAVVGFIGRAGATLATIDTVPVGGAASGELRNQLKADVASLDGHLSELETQVQNCVDVLAAEGPRGITVELSNRIESLRAKKQPLLVEREKCRQKLSSIDQHQLDRERVRHAFERLGRLLPSMERLQQRVLLSGILDQIQITAVARCRVYKSATPRERVLKLVFGVRLTDFVNAMENEVVIDDRTTRTSPYGQRVLNVEAEVVFPRKARVKIVSPFQAELGGGPEAARAIATTVEHPIHRAMRWHAELARGNSMQILAARENVSAALICTHLKLLRLTPSIQEFIRDLTTPAAVALFSLRKLAAISELKDGDQSAELETLRNRFESSTG